MRWGTFFAADRHSVISSPTGRKYNLVFTIHLTLMLPFSLVRANNKELFEKIITKKTKTLQARQLLDVAGHELYIDESQSLNQSNCVDTEM